MPKQLTNPNPKCLHCGMTLVRRRRIHDEFGYKGDNTFCTKDCGYLWALARIAADIKRKLKRRKRAKK